jgi:tetratricopeptide (TPR) repeat protein
MPENTLKTSKNSLFIKALLLFSLILAIGLGFYLWKKSTTPTPEELAEKHFILAESYFNQGDLSASLIEIKNIFQQVPHFEKAVFLKTDILTVAGDIQNALENIEEHLGSLKNQTKAILQIADLSVQKGAAHQASLWLKKLKFDNLSAHEKTHYTLIQAESTLGMGLKNEAEKQFKSVIGMDPKSEKAWLGLAKIADKDGNIQLRTQYFKEIENLNPQNIDLLFWKARLAIDENRREEAELFLGDLLQQFNRYTSMTFNKYQALKMMVDNLMHQGKITAAKPYADLLNSSSQVQLMNLQNEALSLIQNGQFDAAKVLLREILAIAPDHSMAKETLTAIDLSNGDFGAAERHLIKRLPDFPNPTEVRKLIAHLQIEQGKFDAAQTTVTEQLIDFPNDPDWLVLESKLAFMVSDTQKGMASLAKALKESPDHIDALILDAKIQASQNKFKEAKDQYLKAIKINPNNAFALQGFLAAESRLLASKDQAVQALLELKKLYPKSFGIDLIAAQAYVSLEKIQKAEEIIKQTLAAYPDASLVKQSAADIYFEQMNIYLTQNKIPQARTSLDKALALFPDNIALKTAKIGLEFKDNKPANAAKIIQEIQLNQPNQPDGWILEGDLKYAQGEFGQATLSYEKAWIIQPSEALGFRLLEVYHRINRPKEDRLKVFQNWKEKSNGQDITAQFAYASALSQLEFHEKAIKEYESLLKIQADHIPTLNNLALLYQETGHPKKALETANTTFKLAPNNAFVLDTLGWILVLQGKDISTGIELIQKAKTLLPNNPEIEKHLQTAQEKAKFKIPN